MKIKAKKTNSASENAIWSSYFVIELRKLIHLTCSTEVTEVTDSCTLVSCFGLKCKWVESTLSTNQPDVVDCPRANRSPPLDCLHSPIFSWNRRDILSRYSASGSLPLMVAISIFKWKPMQSRETQITMVKWTNAGGQTKRANVYRPPLRMAAMTSRENHLFFLWLPVVSVLPNLKCVGLVEHFCVTKARWRFCFG